VVCVGHMYTKQVCFMLQIVVPILSHLHVLEVVVPMSPTCMCLTFGRHLPLRTLALHASSPFTLAYAQSYTKNHACNQ